MDLSVRSIPFSGVPPKMGRVYATSISAIVCCFVLTAWALSVNKHAHVAMRVNDPPIFKMKPAISIAAIARKRPHKATITDMTSVAPEPI